LKQALLFSSVLLATGLSACSQPAPEPAPPSPFRPSATVQDIMLSIIDPNIDAVWNSVSSVSTAQGSEERRPQTDDEWKILRQHALTVAEAGNLLLIEGRQIAAAGVNTASGGAELNPQDIQQLIAANHAEFVDRAHGLHDAALELVAAIDRKNPEELEEAGGKVEHACEQCHSQFWYPNDKRPQ
jgi:hypothetical protein